MVYINKNIDKTKAFSLIELMVVIAIVALLAAVAVPSYKSYITKAKMVEINNLIQNAMAQVVTAYATGGTTPGTTVAPDNYITYLTPTATATGGTVGVTFYSTSALDANFVNSSNPVILTYTGTVDANGIMSWACVITAGTGAASPNGTTGSTGKAGIIANNYFAGTNSAACT